MDGVRGSEKSLDEFKTHQNAIGSMHDTIETAKMVPACPESVDHLLDNWLEYVNSDSVDTVEKAILSHYQFEAIHPFRDGNGRVGRLIMFRECLAHDLMPFIIDSEHKLFYYRGLRQYADIPEYLDDTCLSAQDHYREVCKKFKV